MEYAQQELKDVLSDIFNISADEAIWDIQVKRIDGTGNPLIFLHALSIYY